MIVPGAIWIDEAAGEVRVHPPPARIGLGFQIRVGIQLREQLLDAHDTKHVHPCLIAVIAGAPVPLAKGVPEGDVGKFLAVPKDAELRFSAEHLAAPNKARLARTIGQAVVFYDL